MSLNRLRKIDTTTEEWAQLIRSIVEKCKTVSGVETIYVFGSFVTDNMTGDSDIDLAVIIQNGISPREFRKQLPSPLSSWPLDLIIVNRDRYEERKDFGGVLFEVAREGIEVFPTWRLQNRDTAR